MKYYSLVYAYHAGFRLSIRYSINLFIFLILYLHGRIEIMSPIMSHLKFVKMIFLKVSSNFLIYFELKNKCFCIAIIFLFDCKKVSLHLYMY